MGPLPPRDCHDPSLSLADAHFYLPPADDSRLANEVEAVLERASWLSEQAPAKPALLGEFGIADDQWRLRPEMNRKLGLPNVHNALWASALSGLSGTALQWWWERLDQQQVYPLYRPLSHFLADVPWTTGELKPAHIKSTNSALRLIGLQSRRERAWIWIFHTGAAWKFRVQDQPTPFVNSATVDIHGLKPGTWNIDWFDTWRGVVLHRETGNTTTDCLSVASPEFEGDIACTFTASLLTK